VLALGLEQWRAQEPARSLAHWAKGSPHQLEQSREFVSLVETPAKRVLERERQESVAQSLGPRKRLQERHLNQWAGLQEPHWVLVLPPSVAAEPLEFLRVGAQHNLEVEERWLKRERSRIPAARGW